MKNKKVLIIFLVLLMLVLSGCQKKETKYIDKDIYIDKIIVLDYTNFNILESDLNVGKDLIGKYGKASIENIEKLEIGIKFKIGNLIFICDGDNNYINGDVLYFKIIDYDKIDDNWNLEIEVIKDELIKRDTSNVDIGTEKDEVLSITTNKSSEDYKGTDYNIVKEELVNLGFNNIKLDEKLTNDTNNINNSVYQVLINNNVFNKDENFNKDDDILIIYWKYEENKLDKIILPQDNTKLGKDKDSSSSQDTAYYINVDGKNNIPKIVKYENANITDGVNEYLNYLKELGYKIEITKVDNRNPYNNFYIYETNFKVSSNLITWTMFLSIQKEDYVEYELDIHLK